MVALTERMALEEGEPFVATVGRLEVKRGTSNVVPGEVEFTLDIRHTDEWKMDAFRARLLAEFEVIANAKRSSYRYDLNLNASPVAMDEGISAEIEAACDTHGFEIFGCQAGLGMMLSCSGRYARSAMIFVPSRAGISHSPEEFTEPADLVAGFQTLVHVLYQYGYGGKADETL